MVVMTETARHDSNAPLEAWMRAVESRDARFDGWVTVGVTSTGIYCRPSCPTPVRPKRKNMEFFPTSAAAQQAGFRSCKRCAPDAVPGSPEWNRRDDLVARAMRAIDDGVIDREGVPGLASRLAVSTRHLTRLLNSEVGASPVALARARRARAARVLIETTDVPFSDVAFASGFESIRQFNDTIRAVFASSPTELRGRRGSTALNGEDRTADMGIDLRMPYRAPFHAAHLFTWFRLHAVNGIEEVDQADPNRPVLRRSLRLEGGPATVELQPADGYVAARFRVSELSDLQTAIQRSRRLLDLDADPAVIEPVLTADPAFASLVQRRPGLRSPGEVDGIDAAIRAVLHQQVSLASARAMCARLVAAHGTPLSQPLGSVERVFPSAEEWAAIDPDTLGMPKARARALVSLAAAVANGDVDLGPSANRADAEAQMIAVKGIGPWTARVVALKALADPDAFAPKDLILRRIAAEMGIAETDDELEQYVERFRPWRAYATHHLWAEYLARSEPSLDGAPHA